MSTNKLKTRAAKSIDRSTLLPTNTGTSVLDSFVFEQTNLRVLSSKQAVTLLGLSHHTLANWRWLGKGPPFFKSHGRHGAVRYVYADLIAWRNLHMRRSTSDEGSSNAR